MDPESNTPIIPVPMVAEASAAPLQAESSSVPEDLRTPWDWVDLLIFGLLALGGTFIISIAVVLIFSTFGVRPVQFRTSPTLRSYFAIVNQVLVSFGLLGFLAAQTSLRKGQSFWRTIGWRPFVTKAVPKPLAYGLLIAGGFALSMMVQFSSGLFRPKGALPIETFFQDRGSALLLMLVSVLIAPVLEETIFRGFIYPVIARSWGIAVSVFITGVIFGFLHAPQLWGGWTQIALLVIVGIVFTYVRAVTKTVTASYVLHLSYNSYLFLIFMSSSHWLRAVPRGH